MAESTTKSTWESTATSVWNNDSKDGNGLINAPNGMMNQSPLELIVAAHATCFNMTFANYLSSKGYKPEEISTRATVTAEGTGMPNMHLETQGRVPSLDAEGFKALADEVAKTCPVCSLMKNNMQVHIDAILNKKQLQKKRRRLNRLRFFYSELFIRVFLPPSPCSRLACTRRGEIRNLMLS